MFHAGMVFVSFHVTICQKNTHWNWFGRQISNRQSPVAKFSCQKASSLQKSGEILTSVKRNLRNAGQLWHRKTWMTLIWWGHSIEHWDPSQGGTSCDLVEGWDLARLYGLSSTSIFIPTAREYLETSPMDCCFFDHHRILSKCFDINSARMRSTDLVNKGGVAELAFRPSVARSLSVVEINISNNSGLAPMTSLSQHMFHNCSIIDVSREFYIWRVSSRLFLIQFQFGFQFQPNMDWTFTVSMSPVVWNDNSRPITG